MPAVSAWETTTSAGKVVRNLVGNYYFYFFYGKALKYFPLTFSKLRNPDNDSSPWCFIYKGTQILWEFCSVPKCPEGAVSQRAAQ